MVPSSKKMVRMINRKRRVNRRPLRLLKKVVNNYRFKRQAITSFITWKYNATTGIDVAKQGLLNLTAATSSVITTAGGLPGFYDVGACQYFYLNDVPSATDFTNLYDRYRINGVKLQITYLSNQSATNGPSSLPVLNYAVDYDDTVAPSTESVMQQKQDLKTKVLIANKPINIYVKNPKVQVPVPNAGAVLENAMVKNAGFINCTYPTIPHCGIKYWLSGLYAGASGNAGCIRIVPTYYLTLRDPQ